MMKWAWKKLFHELWLLFLSSVSHFLHLGKTRRILKDSDKNDAVISARQNFQNSHFYYYIIAHGKYWKRGSLKENLEAFFSPLHLLNGMSGTTISCVSSVGITSRSHRHLLLRNFLAYVYLKFTSRRFKLCSTLKGAPFDEAHENFDRDSNQTLYYRVSSTPLRQLFLLSRVMNNFSSWHLYPFFRRYENGSIQLQNQPTFRSFSYTIRFHSLSSMKRIFLNRHFTNCNMQA